MNQDEWLSVIAIEKQTGIPNPTIRRYINNHGHHLNVSKKGKGYLVALDSIPVMLEIRKLYDEGKTMEQVNDTFAKRDIPMIITMSESNKEVSVNVSEALQDLQKSVNEQNEVIRSLVEQLQKQQEYIDTKLEDRDKRLIQVMRESQEAKKQIAVSQEVNTKKGWFARIFGK